MRAMRIVSGDRNYLLKHSQCEQHKPSRWPATKAIVYVFSVYVFLNTNEMLISQEIGVEEVGGCLLEGDIFLESFGIHITSIFEPHH